MAFNFAHLNPFGRPKAEGTTPPGASQAETPQAQAGDTDQGTGDGKETDKEGNGKEKPAAGADAQASAVAERERCAAILAAPAAAGRVQLACHLAFNTGLSVADAVTALEAAPSTAAAPEAPGNPNALAAMDAHPNPAVGGAADTSGQSGDDKAAAAVLASMAACGLIPKKDGK
ncbi:hypothetical protein [Azospirillum doebereinerae]|uniref:Uncharacterized protein n=1 Tax=Azospirillum doebereinerae TaxID=92933 RepID=A0A433J1B3_9PROT|nr:hypothetical protein [Azospirillum doebereinerae]RUQ63990.1 hypothetical protein EJ913_27080 [Azospirillum doebereinerae]